MPLTGKAGQILRIVMAVATALVAGMNAYLGGHINTADVLGIVIPIAALILAEAHVEGAQAAKSQDQVMLILERLPALVQEILATMQQAQQPQQPMAGQEQAPQGKPPGDGQAS